MHVEPREEDWRRLTQRRWFAIIVALPLAVGFINLFAFLSISQMHPDGVVADYHRVEGLAVYKDDTLSRAAQHSAIDATVKLDPISGLVAISLDTSQQAPKQLRAEFIHPVDASRDTEVILHRTHGANYQGSVNVALDGHWRILLSPMASNEERWVLAYSVEINEDNTVVDNVVVTRLTRGARNAR